jgi:hypothetical protein
MVIVVSSALDFRCRMIFADLPSPAEAGFAKAGNRRPPRITSAAGCFAIMLYSCCMPNS